MMIKRRGIGAIISIAAGLCLYLPFLSRHFDPNGIAEANAVDLGDLFSQNHLLYGSLAFMLKAGLASVGFLPQTVSLMQVITAIMGAVALGALYLALTSLTGDWKAAAAGAAWLGTSFSFWYFSTDISYIVPSAMFATIAFALVVRLRPPTLVGCAAALAILFWQANIFLIPFLVLAPAVLGTWNRKQNYRYVILLLTTCAAIVITVYALVAIFAAHQSGIHQILAWAANYGGGRLPEWGQIAFQRMGAAIHTACASIFPLESRTVHVLFPQIRPRIGHAWLPAFVAFLVLVLWPLIAVIRPQKTSAVRWRILLLLAIGYLCYLPFIIWWDPAESKWFTVPNLFIAGILAMLWCAARWSTIHRTIVIAAIFIISVSNFVITIRVCRFTEKPEIKIAQCVADHMNKEDLFISEDWEWDTYLKYFYKREAFSIIGASAEHSEKSSLFESIDRAIARVQKEGGVVYIPDLDSYPATYLSWLQEQTRLTRGELERLNTIPAFACPGLRVKRLKLAPGIMPKTLLPLAPEVQSAK
jgi:hypothetical protein